MKTCPTCHQTYPDDFDSCPRDGSQLTAEARDERECPHCAEKILKKTRVCKHCGREVEPVVTETPVQNPLPSPSPKIPEPRRPQPQATGPAANSTPWLRAKPEPPSRMRFVVIAVGLVILVGVVLGVTAFVQHEKQQKILAEQAEKTRQAEQAGQAEEAEKAWQAVRARLAEQAEKARQVGQTRQAEKAQLQAEMHKLSVRCGELQDKWDSDPRKHKAGTELSEGEINEVMAEGDAKDDCWKRVQALKDQISPPPTLPPGTVTLDFQRSKALNYRNIASQYLGAAAGDQMYECMVHGFNDPHSQVTVEGVPPLSSADISSCSDLYNRLHSAIERFNRGYK